MLEMLVGEHLHAVNAFAGVQEIVGDHRIAGNTGKFNAVLSQDLHVEFDVLIDLGDAGIFEDRFQLRESDGGIERLIADGAAQCQVVSLARMPAPCQAHDF